MIELDEEQPWGVGCHRQEWERVFFETPTIEGINRWSGPQPLLILKEFSSTKIPNHTILLKIEVKQKGCPLRRGQCFESGKRRWEFGCSEKLISAHCSGLMMLRGGKQRTQLPQYPPAHSDHRSADCLSLG
jgi:hypothetical protein